MTQDRLTVYFVTDHLFREKEKNEIEWWQKMGDVVLVSTQENHDYPGAKHLRISPLSKFQTGLISSWGKLCYLLARLADSSSDFNFPERNYYTGNAFIRSFVNWIWSVKTIGWINKILPRYDSLYFFPFRAIQVIFKRQWTVDPKSAVIVHDALVLRLHSFSLFIAEARNRKIKTIANVKSWDNPYYSQFCTNADEYLVWSKSMWEDIRNVHGLKNKPVHIWGARPFFRFHEALRSFHADTKNKKNNPWTIGYAAAFCDELMGKHEIALIKKIAFKVRDQMPKAKILFRPYPILSLSFYSELQECENIVLEDIQGPTIPYDNGSVVVDFKTGSDFERYSYLSKCDCFLSIATSFTIEAAIFGLPILHFYLEPGHCETKDEIEFFKRISISDHLVKYFHGQLLLAKDYDDLMEKLLSMDKLRETASRLSRGMLEKIGVPIFPETWTGPSPLVQNKLSAFHTQGAGGQCAL